MDTELKEKVFDIAELIWLEIQKGVTAIRVEIETAKYGTDMLYLCAAVLLLIAGIFFLEHNFTNTGRRRRLLRKVKRLPLLSSEEFMAQWKADKKGKENDYPGCYIITTYKRPLLLKTNRAYFKRLNSYVGQSDHVRRRVKNHFSGFGCGDVYAALKSGEAVYVKIMPCPERKLNIMERELIALFGSTLSYNRTSGGGPDRTKKKSKKGIKNGK